MNSEQRSHSCNFEEDRTGDDERQRQTTHVFAAPLHLTVQHAEEASIFLPLCQYYDSRKKRIRTQRVKKQSFLSRLSLVLMVIPTLSICSTEAISIVNRHSLQTLKSRPRPRAPPLPSPIISNDINKDSNIVGIIKEARLLRKEKSNSHSSDSTTTRTTNSDDCSTSLPFLSSSATVASFSWNALFDEHQDCDLEQSTRDGLFSSRLLLNDGDESHYFESDMPDMELHLQKQAAKVRAIATASSHVNHGVAFVSDSLSSLNMATAVLTRESPSQQQQQQQQQEPRIIMEKHLHSLKRHNERRQKDGNHNNHNLPGYVPVTSKVSNDRKKNNNGGGSHHSKTRSLLANSNSSSPSNKDYLGNNNDKVEIPKENNVQVRSSAVGTVSSNSAAFGSTKRNAKQQNTMTDAVGYRISHDEEIQLSRIIQRGVELHSLKSKFEQEHGRDITRQEWAELAKLESPKQLRRMVSDYRIAKNKLVMGNMGLVHAVVRSKMGIISGSGKDRVHKSGISYEEMVQEGSLGLLRAAELFDPSRGLRFSTYATIWIKGMLSNSNISETIKVPLREKNKWNKIQSVISELQLKFGSNDTKYRPTDEAIAERSGMDVDTVKDVMEKMKNTKNILSLDYQYETQSRSGGDVSSFEALQHDKNLMDDVDLVERLHVRTDVIAAIVKNLDRREAQLMCLRYGLNDGRTRSIKECAEEMGISQSRAQQLATGCLKKLREADDADSLHEYLLSMA